MPTLDKAVVVCTAAAATTAAVAALAAYLYDPRYVTCFTSSLLSPRSSSSFSSEEQEKRSSRKSRREPRHRDHPQGQQHPAGEEDKALRDPRQATSIVRTATTAEQQRCSDSTAPPSSETRPTDTMPRIPAAAVAGSTPGTREDERSQKRALGDDHNDGPLESDLGAIRSLLATTTLSEFLAARHIGRAEGITPPRNVLVLTPSCTVGEALSKLVRGEEGVASEEATPEFSSSCTGVTVPKRTRRKINRNFYNTAYKHRWQQS